ncbi:hypothetical protein [Acaryochloris sp. IP29b_bin.137]|nr:hypothetical protein [Acaryochloris sp. IP29b_bin.137]
MITGGTGGLGLGVTLKVLTTGAEVTLPYIAELEAERLSISSHPQN